MILNFKKITIHHFLSFEHAEIELKDKGYCIVKGINRNPKDSAKSNGAGKSTIFNAVSYALTGETLQGLKSNLANIYFDDGCWVELQFEVNGHQYVLTRSKDDKQLGTNLKIVIDGEDKSGKGIRESQALLDQYLPELTSELIGSTIMIGQGMPMKFTSNSPSGRKEVLEHLSQSDFMIQDLKERINRRIEELSTIKRGIEDDLLKFDTTTNVYQNQLTSAQNELNEKFTTPIDFDSVLQTLNEEKEVVDNNIKKYREEVQTISTKQEETNAKLLSLTKEKSDLVNKYAQEHQEATIEFNREKSELVSRANAINQEIIRLKSIKDICPTCGQKIPGAVKPDTTQQENEYKLLQDKIKVVELDIVEDRKAYQEVLDKVNSKYDATIQTTQNLVTSYSQEKRTLESSVATNQTRLDELTRKIVETTSNKEMYNSNKQKLLDTIKTLTKNLEEIDVNRDIVAKSKELVDTRNEIVSKMNTIVKRDFRGFLLKNIIDFINAKAKEYASQIFGCDEIGFELDGNDINITFCGKDYDNLSGGEKQRVDLIVQFAIRSFMCNFLQFSSNILVLDEITDALDSESCDRVINFITNELKDIESVFIISHHSDELELPIDSTIEIEKNELGVSNVIHQE